MFRSIVLATLFIMVGGAVSGGLAMLVPPLLMGARQATTPPPSGTCDYGPSTTLPTGGAGTDVSTAGFTHCVLYANFTDNSGTLVASGPGSTTWKMNDPTTYSAACNGASTSSFGSFWLNFGGPGLPFDITSAPCNRATIVNDGSGTNVLTWTFSSSDISGNRAGLALMWPKCGSPCGAGPALPISLYEEFTWRISAGNSSAPAFDIFAGDEQTNLQGVDPTQCVPNTNVGCQMDMVWGEYPAQNHTTAISLDNYCINCGVGNNKGSVGWNVTPDLANYHTFANLTTTDGSTVINSCIYLDNALYPGTSIIDFAGVDNINASCAHWPFNGQTVVSNQLSMHDRRFWRFIGDYTNGTPLPGDLPSPITIQVKSIRIFACTNYLGSGHDCTAAQSGGSLVYH